MLSNQLKVNVCRTKSKRPLSMLEVPRSVELCKFECSLNDAGKFKEMASIMDGFLYRLPDTWMNSIPGCQGARVSIPSSE